MCLPAVLGVPLSHKELISCRLPLVGATLGAVVAIAVAALHSLPAAIVVLVVFVVYQQVGCSGRPASPGTGATWLPSCRARWIPAS